jgi:hypothetical protein
MFKLDVLFWWDNRWPTLAGFTNLYNYIYVLNLHLLIVSPFMFLGSVHCSSICLTVFVRTFYSLR